MNIFGKQALLGVSLFCCLVSLTQAVNINKATKEEIKEELIGVGEKKAQAIIEYREEHGDFKSADELSEVKGIGQAILDKNRNKIEIR